MVFRKLQHFLLYLFAFSVVFENWPLLSINGNSIPKIIGYIFVGVSLLNVKFFLTLKRLKGIILPLILFLSALIISFILNADNSKSAWWLVRTIILNVFIFIIILDCLVREPAMGYRMFIFLIIGIFIMTLLYMLNIGIEFTEGRLSILGENPNRIGTYSVIGIFFILSLVFENKQNLPASRFWLLLFLLPFLKIAADTGSRVTFIGLLFSLVAFFSIQKKEKVSDKLFIYATGIIAIILVFYYLTSNDLLRERMLATLKGGDLAGRDSIWRLILPTVLDNLFLGIGANGYSSLSFYVFGRFVSPHNVFIELMAYSGLIGLFTFLLFYIRLTVAAWKINKNHAFALPVVLLFFIFLIFFTGQGIGVKLFWVIYAYILSVSLNYNDNIAETPTANFGVSEMVIKKRT